MKHYRNPHIFIKTSAIIQRWKDIRTFTLFDYMLLATDEPVDEFLKQSDKVEIAYPEN